MLSKVGHNVVFLLNNLLVKHVKLQSYNVGVALQDHLWVLESFFDDVFDFYFQFLQVSQFFDFLILGRFPPLFFDQDSDGEAKQFRIIRYYFSRNLVNFLSHSFISFQSIEIKLPEKLNGWVLKKFWKKKTYS